MKILESVNRHSWKIYLLWIFAGFLLWNYLAYLAITEDPDAPSGIYLFPAWIMGFILHVIPMIVLAVILYFWRRRQAKIR